MDINTYGMREEWMKVTLTQAIRDYLMLLAQEGKSPETIEWHKKKLNAFREFISPDGDDILVCELTIDDARRFIKFLMDRKTKYPNHPHHDEREGGLAPATVNGYARSLKAFSSKLHEEGYTEINIFKRLKAPKIPQTLIEPLSEDEIRQVLFVVPQDRSEGIRNFAILTLFIDSGIRISELTELKIDNIDFAGGSFKVFGKGSIERVVPLGRTASRAVLRYLEHYRLEPFIPGDKHLFLTIDGRPMSRNAVGAMVKRVGRRSGIDRLHPHLLRHTFAVRYLINGGDVFTLQKILGHKSLEMTRRYVRLANVDILDKHRVFSPMDNLGIAPRRGRRRKRQR
jgi:integrase/recombinase XerC/integrase/recombinase XerD